jgi:hypothetical protein
MVINFMAKNGIRDLSVGLQEFEAAMSAYFDHKGYELGLPLDTYVAERVSIKCREFNTQMNPVPELDHEAVMRQKSEAYIKASGG